MRIRDKTITAACRTRDGIEWTSLKAAPDGDEPARHGALAVALPEGGDAGTQDLALPPELSGSLKGDVTIALPASELLLRTMELPSADAAEIADMVAFQLDKLFPFAAEQMAIAHEVLRQSENSALVLMAAARRERIDAIGDAFVKIGVRIHSIDARVLGWLRLLQDARHTAGQGCELIAIDDGIDFVLAVLLEGVPVAFRSIHACMDEPAAAEELAYETGYTLAALDAEQPLPAEPAAIQVWCFGQVPASLQDQLASLAGLPVATGNLDDLPHLSEGIIRRTLDAKSRIELIPQEWVDHERNKRLLRSLYRYAAAIVSVWLAVLAVLFGTYKARDVGLERVRRKADALAPVARQALEDRQKLRALKLYTDRARSPLECLREIVRMMPLGDIEFASYNYAKGKGITLRGTAATDDTVYDFFESLASSELFERLKDQSVNTRTSQNVRRSVFSATLDLPPDEEDSR